MRRRWEMQGMGILREMNNSTTLRKPGTLASIVSFEQREISMSRGPNAYTHIGPHLEQTGTHWNILEHITFMFPENK